jgi:hypothetical protein
MLTNDPFLLTMLCFEYHIFVGSLVFLISDSCLDFFSLILFDLIYGFQKYSVILLPYPVCDRVEVYYIAAGRAGWL